MTNNYYQIYIQKVLQLAETIVIKSTEAADLINTNIAVYYGDSAVDLLDPKSWKYYLNLAGEYHFTDVDMEVVSMDTLEKINFTRENLLVHRATARGYAYGSRHYNELVTKYPQQETLILGILYPVDIDAAIAAKDGAILGYPKELVEFNEYSLMSKLQKWIDGYKVRWTNQQFGISDSLYAATALGIMYLNLVPAILTFRLEACKTNEAHSFHVRQYLASHGLLDVYMDTLTTKQALFFYRNIAYIERNAGKKEIFEWLVEHIMTERRLPLAEYVMRHDLSKQPAELYPTLSFKKNQINLGYNLDPLDRVSLKEILLKENALARDNAIYMDEYQPVIQEQMENSLSSVVLTKALESSVVDYTNSTPYKLEEILISQWLNLCASDRYTAFIGVNHPRTGERIPLNVKEAYIFAWYALCGSINIVVDKIPLMYAKRVQRIPAVTVDELMSVVDSNLISRDFAEKALSKQPDIVTVISTEAFYNTCVEIFDACQFQRNLISTIEHMDRRAMANNLVSRIYSDNICNLATETDNYTAWFASRNIQIADFTRMDLETIYRDLVREATGLSLVTTNSLRNLQASMIKMLDQLSSYSVQFIAQINKSDITVTDWPVMRVGDTDLSISGKSGVSSLVAGVLDSQITQNSKVSFDFNVVGADTEFTTASSQIAHCQIQTKPHYAAISDLRKWNVRAAVVGVQLTNGLPQTPDDVVPVVGIDSFLSLTEEQQREIASTAGL